MTKEPWAPIRSQTGFVEKTDYFLEIFCLKCKLNGLTDIVTGCPKAPSEPNIFWFQENIVTILNLLLNAKPGLGHDVLTFL